MFFHLICQFLSICEVPLKDHNSTKASGIPEGALGPQTLAQKLVLESMLQVSPSKADALNDGH